MSDSKAVPQVHSAQRTSGLRSIFSLAPVYRFAQNTIGATKARIIIASELIRIQPDDRVLDIGCGTGDILTTFPKSVDYVGFDPSPAYIADARLHYGDRGQFFVAGTNSELPHSTADRTLATAIGVFHHLDDAGVIAALSQAHAALLPTGRFVSVDPTLVEGQHPIGRFLAKKDRGQFVRTPTQIEVLVRQVFPNVTVSVRHDMLRVPYSHVVVQCSSLALADDLPTTNLR